MGPSQLFSSKQTPVYCSSLFTLMITMIYIRTRFSFNSCVCPLSYVFLFKFTVNYILINSIHFLYIKCIPLHVFYLAFTESLTSQYTTYHKDLYYEYRHYTPSILRSSQWVAGAMMYGSGALLPNPPPCPAPLLLPPAISTMLVYFAVERWPC